MDKYSKLFTEKRSKMDLSRIKKGMNIKNYSVMCELLGEKIKSGNSKISQLKEWSRYFKFNKRGNQIHIVRIYDEPLQVIDGRAGRKIQRRGGKNINLIEPLLLNLLVKSETAGDITISRNALYEYLGVINRNFLEYNNFRCLLKDGDVKIVSNNNEDKWNINGQCVSGENIAYFYEISRTVIYQMLSTVFNSLEKRGVLKAQSWYKIEYNTGDIFVADINEAETIGEIEKNTAESMGVNIGVACSTGFRAEYYNKRNNAAKKLENWNRIYDTIRVTALDKNVLYDKSILNINVSELRIALNQIVCEKIMERIRSNYSGGVGDKKTLTNKIKKKAFSNENFFDIQEYLVSKLILLP